MAEWATALLLSNESFGKFSYAGAAWSPLHERLRHLDSQDLRTTGATAKLRTDDISAFVTGAGQGGPAEISVHSAEDTKPHVAVVRFSGPLPR